MQWDTIGHRQLPAWSFIQLFIPNKHKFTVWKTKSRSELYSAENKQ